MVTRILVFLLLFSCNLNAQNIRGLILDSTIGKIAQQHFVNNEVSEMTEDMLIYNNKVALVSYENDSLVYQSDSASALFKSFYMWYNDTLFIEGAIGMWGGFGFHIEIINDTAAVYHLLASDEIPTYSYNRKDSVISRLDVPCERTKIVLSHVPDDKSDKILYGYVEFESHDYYSISGVWEAGNPPPKDKLRKNMKIYFMSTKANL